MIIFSLKAIILIRVRIAINELFKLKILVMILKTCSSTIRKNYPRKEIHFSNNAIHNSSLYIAVHMIHMSQ